MFKSPRILESHPQYISSQSETVLEIIGGSQLYAIATPQSDKDYRGIFVPYDKKIRAGFKSLDSIVTKRDSDDTEGAYYSLRHFMNLLFKTNTQAMELIHAPDDAYTTCTPAAQYMRDMRYRFIDSDKLKKSFKGYMAGERARAYGESKANYGSLRKDLYDAYGYIPKSVGNLLRLVATTKHFFESGNYVVRPRDINVYVHDTIMNIRNHPEKFTINDIRDIVESYYDEAILSIANSDVHYEFDQDLAADIILYSNKS